MKYRIEIASQADYSSLAKVQVETDSELIYRGIVVGIKREFQNALIREFVVTPDEPRAEAAD